MREKYLEAVMRFISGLHKTRVVLDPPAEPAQLGLSQQESARSSK